MCSSGKAHLPGLIVRIKHALYCLHSFKRSRMRQQHAADHIACRIHAGKGSRVAVIHLDESLFRQLQVQAGSGGNNRLHADGYQADIRRDFLFLSLAVFTLALTCPSQVSVTDSTEAPVITLMPCF